jgi:putative phosphoesterase
VLIAILSDIHGNSAALTQVLAEASRLKVGHLLILGDQIGYYYDAPGVCDLLDSWSRDAIRGNHEDMLLDHINCTLDIEAHRKRYGKAIEIASKTLSGRQLEDFQNQPRTKRLSIDGVRILMAHGAPWSTEEYVYPDADELVLNRCDFRDCDFIFLGHTHYPFIYAGNNSAVINPGSVGQSRVCGGIADWGILNTRNGVYIPKNTPYDVTALCQLAKETDPDVPYLYEVLIRNRIK